MNSSNVQNTANSHNGFSNGMIFLVNIEQSFQPFSANFVFEINHNYITLFNAGSVKYFIAIFFESVIGNWAFVLGFKKFVFIIINRKRLQVKSQKLINRFLKTCHFCTQNSFFQNRFVKLKFGYFFGQK